MFIWVFEIEEKKISVAHPERCHLCLVCKTECLARTIKIAEIADLTGEIR